MPMWWDEMRWGKWHKHCEKVLGYYWPAEKWEGEYFASSDAGSSFHDVHG